MSDTNRTNYNCPPSNPDKRVEKDGYRAGFYPGFVRRLAVRDEKGTVVDLYEQDPKVPFCLPPGVGKPWPCSTVEFVRPSGRRISLTIDDAEQQIDRIEIHLKAAVAPLPGTEAGLAVQVDAVLGEDPPPPQPDDPPVVVVIEDGPVLCPPMCPDPEGE